MKLVNQQLIKNTNLKQLYNSIYQNPGTSRAQLSKDSHLSKTAVSSLVDELIARKFVYDSGTGGSTTVGRKPNSLLLRAEQYYVAVLCLEEDRLNAALVDITGVSSLPMQMEASSPEAYIPLCRDYIEQTVLTRIRKEQLLGICIVVPAMIDPDKRGKGFCFYQFRQRNRCHTLYPKRNAGTRLRILHPVRTLLY